MPDFNPSEGVAVYTDGSSWNKDRSGGWAWVAIDAFGNEHFQFGAASDTTNNRMEMTAALEALITLGGWYGPLAVLVRSDSEYVVRGASNRRRARHKNVDIWNYLDAAVDLHEWVEFEHVKGHAGDHYNEMVDGLAGAARKQGQA